MKKVLFGFAFSLIGYLGYSQVDFGVKSGINIATTKDFIAFPKNRLGWYAGGFAKIPVHKRLFFQPELLYSSKGNGEKKYTAVKTVFSFNYLNALILLGYNIDHKTSLVFGPELGYLTSARMIYDNNGSENVTKNYPPKFDIGLDVGLSYRIIKNVGVEVRYNYGFNTLYSVDAVGNRNIETKGANRVFQIGFTYMFNKTIF